MSSQVASSRIVSTSPSGERLEFDHGEGNTPLTGGSAAVMPSGRKMEMNSTDSSSAAADAVRVPMEDDVPQARKVTKRLEGVLSWDEYFMAICL